MLDAYHNMIENQLRAGGIHLPQIFEAFDAVDRQAFVPETYRNYAFADMPIPLVDGQQMLLPLTDAKILQAAIPKKTDTVLEIGTGSGFSAALMAQLTRYVTTLEINPSLAETARHHLQQQAVHNAQVICADAFATDLHQTGRKFDIIVFSGAISTLPDIFCDMLSDEGRMVVFRKQPALTQAELIEKTAGNVLKPQRLFETDMTPLIQPEQRGFIF